MVEVNLSSPLQSVVTGRKSGAEGLMRSIGLRPTLMARSCPSSPAPEQGGRRAAGWGHQVSGGRNVPCRPIGEDEMRWSRP